MKALHCTHWGGYQALDLAQVEPPRLKPGCVRIAVHYATITLGQVLVVAGKYQRKPPLPFVPGTEVSGVVAEVAADVSGFRVGDRGRRDARLGRLWRRSDRHRGDGVAGSGRH